MPRTCKGSWIDNYRNCLRLATKSPERYHFWSAAVCISSALKRSVWIEQPTWRMFPNLYVVLVGRPGIGKGEAMTPAISLMKEAGTSNVISDRITMEYALEKMSKGFPKIHPNQQVGQNGNQNSSIKLGMESAALITSQELSVFITASQFTISCLTDLWDCREGEYQYGTRGKGEWNVSNPSLNLFGASAQEWLVKSIPADAVGGGFTRRVNFVLETKIRKTPPIKGLWEREKPALVEDLRYISLLRGNFSLTKDAKDLFTLYQEGCEPDDFDDIASAVYKSSKWTNVGKLAQIISVARSDDLVIDEDDVGKAIVEIEHVSEDLKTVFRTVGESTLIVSTDRVVRFLEKRGWAKRSEILAHNWKHFTSNELDVIIVTLREAGMLVERTIGNQIEYAWRDSTKP